jgi:hypothetical protein
LVFNFDPGGLDIINEPIRFVTPKELADMAKQPRESLPPLTAIDLSAPMHELDLALKPISSSEGLQATLSSINALVRATPIPWKTVVLDPLSGLNEQIVSHVAKDQPASLADARKWAGMAGSKMTQIINTMVTLPCHSVCIMHEQVDKDERTSETERQPMLTGKIRDRANSIFSQFFYQCIEAGSPVIYTMPRGLTVGLGSRWPDLTKKSTITNPTFKNIYGSEELL